MLSILALEKRRERMKEERGKTSSCQWSKQTIRERARETRIEHAEIPQNPASPEQECGVEGLCTSVHRDIPVQSSSITHRKSIHRERRDWGRITRFPTVASSDY